MTRCDVIREQILRSAAETAVSMIPRPERTRCLIGKTRYLVFNLQTGI